MMNEEKKRELRRLYRKPENIRLKCLAWLSISIALVLLVVLIIWLDTLSYRTILVLRGCVGVATILFVVFYAILQYRIYREFHKQA